MAEIYGPGVSLSPYSYAGDTVSPSVTYLEQSGYAGVQGPVTYYPARTNPSRVTYTPPILLPPPPELLGIEVVEGMRLSSDDELVTGYRRAQYMDSRGVGDKWSNGRVSLAAGETSSQLVLGAFGFKVPPNAVIKSVEIVVESGAALTVDVMPCAFAAPGFNALTSTAWTGQNFSWAAPNWVSS